MCCTGTVLKNKNSAQVFQKGIYLLCCSFYYVFDSIKCPKIIINSVKLYKRKLNCTKKL